MFSVGEVHFLPEARPPFQGDSGSGLVKAVYLPDPGPVELLLRELAISESDHQDDDVTPLIIGSDVVLSLWRCVSLTVSLPQLGGRVKHLLKITSSAWIVSRFRLAKRLSVERSFNELSKRRIQV